MDTPQFNCQVLYLAYGVDIPHIATSNHESLLLLQFSSRLFAMLMISVEMEVGDVKKILTTFMGRREIKSEHIIPVWFIHREPKFVRNLSLSNMSTI